MALKALRFAGRMLSALMTPRRSDALIGAAERGGLIHPHTAADLPGSTCLYVFPCWDKLISTLLCLWVRCYEAFFPRLLERKKNTGVQSARFQ